MNRPIESGYTSQVAYTRALEAYCDSLPQLEQPAQYSDIVSDGGMDPRNKFDKPAQRKPLTADELKEPKNGEQWHVVWWNESCRMMLPSDAKLDSFVAYGKGTLQFTIKKAAYGIKEKNT